LGSVADGRRGAFLAGGRGTTATAILKNPGFVAICEERGQGALFFGLLAAFLASSFLPLRGLEPDDDLFLNAGFEVEERKITSKRPFPGFWTCDNNEAAALHNTKFKTRERAMTNGKRRTELRRGVLRRNGEARQARQTGCVHTAHYQAMRNAGIGVNEQFLAAHSLFQRRF
jgi:hypothetical protein